MTLHIIMSILLLFTCIHAGLKTDKTTKQQLNPSLLLDGQYTSLSLSQHTNFAEQHTQASNSHTRIICLDNHEAYQTYSRTLLSDFSINRSLALLPNRRIVIKQHTPEILKNLNIQHTNEIQENCYSTSCINDSDIQILQKYIPFHFQQDDILILLPPSLINESIIPTAEARMKINHEIWHAIIHSMQRYSKLAKKYSSTLHQLYQHNASLQKLFSRTDPKADLLIFCYHLLDDTFLNRCRIKMGFTNLAFIELIHLRNPALLQQCVKEDVNTLTIEIVLTLLQNFSLLDLEHELQRDEYELHIDQLHDFQEELKNIIKTSAQPPRNMIK